MSYSGSQSEKPVAAGDLDRSHIGQTVSFESNDFTVVFGTLSGIARTEAMVYLSLHGVGGGTHLKDEYDVPVGHNVYVQMDPLSTAGKTVAETERVIKEKFDETKKPPEPGTETGLRVTGIRPARNPAVPSTAGFLVCHCAQRMPGGYP